MSILTFFPKEAIGYFDDSYLLDACERLSDAESAELDLEVLQYQDSAKRNILHYLGYYGHHAAYIKHCSAHTTLAWDEDKDQLLPAAYWVPVAFADWGAGKYVDLLTKYLFMLVNESYKISLVGIRVPEICYEPLEAYANDPVNVFEQDHTYALIGNISMYPSTRPC